jgi:hypothetical protein
VTVGAADVISPMLTATEVIVFLFPSVTGQTGFGDLLRGFVFERDDFCGVAFGDVLFTWSMTRFTSGDLVLPAAETAQFCMRRWNKVLELIFVAISTCFAAHVTIIGTDGPIGRGSFARCR